MRKIFPLLLAATVLLSCAPEIIEPEAVLSCVQPSALKPGDKIALISPAYFTPRANIDTASAILRAWGFKPVLGANANKEYLGYYAGTPKERLADLKWALKDPSIKAILSIRGGYGSIHLIPMLPLNTFARHPKWLIGFSDITTLHGMENRAGVMSIHGTMCSLMARSHGEGLTNTLLRDLLNGTVPQYEVPAHPLNQPGLAQGVLVGGNLSCITPILGTEADATQAGGIILFLEEVEEDMSHIDRMINALLLGGVFDRCRGVILGEFTDCEANLGYDSVEQMICSYLQERDIPVLCGFPAGHGDVNLPLLMGAPVTLDVRETGATLTFDVAGETQIISTETETETTESI
jgi:muramoyltetrapeptide carboxypeptidase